jgi:hypothetical protein
VWIGNGITAGGVPVVGSNVAGYGLTYNNVTHKIEVSGLTTDDVEQGVNNKYFSTELAVDAVGAALVAGNATNVGITFTYAQTQDDAGRINATVALDGVGIAAVVDDTEPQLGGNLDLNGSDITGTGNINITGDIDVAGMVTATELSTPTLTVDDITTTNALGVIVKANASTPLSISGIGTLGPTSGQVYFNINAAKGSQASPTTTAAGDGLGGIAIQGYDGSNYKSAALIAASWDSSATLSDTFPKSSLRLIAGGGGSTLRQAILDANGVFTAPSFRAGDGTAGNPSIGFTTDGSTDTGIFHPGDGILCISTDATERVRVDNGGMRVNGFMKVADCAGTLPSPAEAGMIVLDGSTFKGYNGTSWVTLG